MILNEVKDKINQGAYQNKKGYKWLQDKYTTFLLLQTIKDNNLKDTREVIQYLEKLVELLQKQ